MKTNVMRLCMYGSLLVMALFTNAWTFSASSGAPGEKDFIGRWDIDVIGSNAARPIACWFELKLENGTLKGRLQPGGGATVDVTEIKIENGELSFRPVNQMKTLWKATAKGGHLEGTTNSSSYGKEISSWTASRGPVWPAVPPKRKPGKPVNLIGKDVSGWLLQNPNKPIGWSVKDGILLNEGKQANNIYSKQKFQDFKVEAEFKIDPKSNSGLYLRGRYEIQVMDGYDATSQNIHSMGALYGYIAPPVNACKPASEWQTFEITLIANRVTVTLNGTKLIDNVEVPGLTGGALDSREKESGPIMLQGDHGPVQWRKLIVTPLI
jgi:hypothetical protein